MFRLNDILGLFDDPDSDGGLEKGDHPSEKATAHGFRGSSVAGAGPEKIGEDRDSHRGGAKNPERMPAQIGSGRADGIQAAAEFPPTFVEAGSGGVEAQGEFSFSFPGVLVLGGLSHWRSF